MKNFSLKYGCLKVCCRKFQLKLGRLKLSYEKFQPEFGLDLKSGYGPCANFRPMIFKILQTETKKPLMRPSTSLRSVPGTGVVA